MRPFFHKEPQDAIVLADGSVRFECVAGGEPPPRVVWRRQDNTKHDDGSAKHGDGAQLGLLPLTRAQILDDKSLRIDRVLPEDEGVYVCEAENDVGAVSSRATLTVHGIVPKSKNLTFPTITILSRREVK